MAASFQAPRAIDGVKSGDPKKRITGQHATIRRSWEAGVLSQFLLWVGWGYDLQDWGRRTIGMIDFKGSHFEGRVANRRRGSKNHRGGQHFTDY
jgi:hypothetical protein